MRSKKLYWAFQISGWTIYSLLNLIFYSLQATLTLKDFLNYLLWIPIGIGLTHIYRFIIIKRNWLRLKIYFQIPLVVICSVLIAFIFLVTLYLFESISSGTFSDINAIASLVTILNLSFVIFFWSIVYFAYHVFVNYKRSEIQSLVWQARNKEIELNKIKSQLNPHFMFNSMNSIRALIDENPVKAKDAITKLSGILRTTLMLEKLPYLSVSEELRIVKDYLELEKIRFEERLQFSIINEALANGYVVPPLLIQTLAENGIKHGVSKLTAGGYIHIELKNEEENLIISITNPGQFDTNKIPESGFGLRNSIERLNHLFQGKALLKVYNENTESVKTILKLPIFVETLHKNKT
jgi:sensor histidine kinase YesM